VTTCHLEDLAQRRDGFAGRLGGVLAFALVFAPRIPPRLVHALDRLDDRRLPIAELNRRLGAEAERMGLRRPSYERVRQLLHLLRRWRRRQPTTARVLVEVAYRSRPPTALLDHLSGIGVPQLPP
jgi:hypothetical protein